MVSHAQPLHAKTHPPPLPDTLSIPPETDAIIPTSCSEYPKRKGVGDRCQKGHLTDEDTEAQRLN